MQPRSRSWSRSLTAVLTGLLIPWVAPVSSASSVGWVRLAHFSPDTPAVDVYLASFSSPGRPAVFRAVGYGALSPYSALPAGRYTISMRGAGAPASSPPVITTDVRVAAGRAYTVAGLGRNASLALRVLGDDLSAPPAGSARLRVISASLKAPVLSVTDAGGSVLVKNAQFASASPYVTVPSKATTLAVTAGSGAGNAAQPVASTHLDAKPGSVYSLVVLDQPKGVKVLVRDDARGVAAAPVGGVETGLGGTAPGGDPWPDPTRVALFGLSLLLFGGGVLAVRAAQDRERVVS